MKRKDLQVGEVVWWYSGYLWNGLDVDGYTKRPVRVLDLGLDNRAKCLVQEFEGRVREVYLSELRS